MIWTDEDLDDGVFLVFEYWKKYRQSIWSMFLKANEGDNLQRSTTAF